MGNPENEKNDIEEFYRSDAYITKNPTLDIQDSPWKVSKIIPLIDEFIHGFNDKIKILDVGGGAGLILKEASIQIESMYGIKVKKYALDLSPGMLKIQKTNNPDLIKSLNEDICSTSLTDKEIDLILMIDVLEHITNPIIVLEEMKRISRFIIFKVPLEDNFCSRLLNFLTRGKHRQRIMEKVGHIQLYNLSSLIKQIEKHTGLIINYNYTNVFDFVLNSEDYNKKTSFISKTYNFLGSIMYRFSPKFCSLIFEDFIMILVKCY